MENLREPIEGLIHRHIEAADARVWYPHEVTPWILGGDFKTNEEWTSRETQLTAGEQSALFVILLTEDNLPYYFEGVRKHTGKGHPLHDIWAPLWTSEEGRHSIVIRDWISLTGALDLRKLEDARRAQVSSNVAPDPETGIETLGYTTIQEPATKVKYGRVIRRADKESYGKKMFGLVAGDENLHGEFYGGATEAAVEIDPSTTTIAVAKQVIYFTFPGVGIPDFTTHQGLIRRERIFGIHELVNDVHIPTLNRLGIFKHEGLSSDAEQARELLSAHIERLVRIGKKEVERARELEEASA